MLGRKPIVDDERGGWLRTEKLVEWRMQVLRNKRKNTCRYSFLVPAVVSGASKCGAVLR